VLTTRFCTIVVIFADQSTQLSQLGGQRRHSRAQDHLPLLHLRPADFLPKHRVEIFQPDWALREPLNDLLLLAFWVVSVRLGCCCWGLALASVDLEALSDVQIGALVVK